MFLLHWLLKVDWRAVIVVFFQINHCGPDWNQFNRLVTLLPFFHCANVMSKKKRLIFNYYLRTKYFLPFFLPDGGSKPDTVDSGKDHWKNNQAWCFPTDTSLHHIMGSPNHTEVTGDNCKRTENNEAHQVSNQIICVLRWLCVTKPLRKKFSLLKIERLLFKLMLHQGWVLAFVRFENWIYIFHKLTSWQLTAISLDKTCEP
jgi:hypothetical protein